MLYRKIRALCSEVHTKDINALCVQNVELWNTDAGSSQSNH